MDHILSSPSPSVPRAASLSSHEAKESTTEDVGEDVLHPRTAPASFPQALFSTAVIELLLFRVCEHLVGKADFFELHIGFREEKVNKIKLKNKTISLLGEINA